MLISFIVLFFRFFLYYYRYFINLVKPANNPHPPRKTPKDELQPSTFKLILLQTLLYQMLEPSCRDLRSDTDVEVIRSGSQLAFQSILKVFDGVEVRTLY